MDVPAAVASVLGDESVAAHVPLRGDDALFVTPSRTIVYHADGLLSSESVEEFGHDAERVTVDDGRRKATVTLDYGLDGERSFVVPSGRIDDVLLPVVAGVLNAAGVTDPGESVSRTYYFNELTLVVTDRRIVRHVGAAVWDTESDEIAFADVTGFDTEEGSVASQLVLETTGRTQRLKVPNEQFRDVRETVEQALYEAHDVSSRAAFNEAMRENEAETDAADDDEDTDAGVAFAESDIDVIGGSSDDTETAPADTAEPQPTTRRTNSESTASTSTGDSATATEPTPANDASPTEATERTAPDPSESPAATPASDQTELGRVDAPGESGTSAPVTADSADATDLDALAAELEAARDAIADQRDRAESQRDTLARQQRAIDAQLDALDEQRERIEAALDAIPDR